MEPGAQGLALEPGVLARICCMTLGMTLISESKLTDIQIIIVSTL